LFWHLESFKHFQPFQAHLSQLNNPTKNQSSHVSNKCKNWMDNYKCAINRTCSQMWIILCIQSSLFVKVEGFNQSNMTKLFHLKHVMVSISTTFFLNTTRFGFVFIYKKKPTKDCKWKTFQAEVGFWENFNPL